MERINFNDFAKLCYKAKEPIFITQSGKKNLVLMDENLFNEYEEAKRVEDVLQGFEQIEKGEFEDGEKVVKELRSTYGL